MKSQIHFEKLLASLSRFVQIYLQSSYLKVEIPVREGEFEGKRVSLAGEFKIK
jgi:hypothetical protein